MPADELRWLHADLHLHTVLSPCAEVEMIPPLIVRQALALGLDILAVTDHNTAANCAAVMAAAEGTCLKVLPGMELQTAEELHVVCVYDEIEQAMDWQAVVYAHLPDRPNREDLFGPQYLVDLNGDYLQTERRLLLASTDLTLDQVVSEVTERGGLVIPAHIDRPAFGLLAVLGFVPAELGATALELHRSTGRDQFLSQQPGLAGRCLIRGSDAHRLAEMMPSICVRVGGPSTAELRKAFANAGRGEAGRICEWICPT